MNQFRKSLDGVLFLPSVKILRLEIIIIQHLGENEAVTGIAEGLWSAEYPLSRIPGDIRTRPRRVVFLPYQIWIIFILLACREFFHYSAAAL